VFAENFGRDYLTESGWNVAATKILRGLQLHHQANVAAARKLQYNPPAAGRATHPAEDSSDELPLGRAPNALTRSISWQ
jgi:hypothetical protein